MSVQLSIAIALQLSIAGCWPYLAPTDPVVEPLRLQPRRKLRTCAALETIAGELPRKPDMDVRCGHHVIDEDRYRCQANEMWFYAGEMWWWGSACDKQLRRRTRGAWRFVSVRLR